MSPRPSSYQMAGPDQHWHGISPSDCLEKRHRKRSSSGSNTTAPADYTTMMMMMMMSESARHLQVTALSSPVITGGWLPADCSVWRLPASLCRHQWPLCPQLGDRSFPVVGPRIWNSLPASLRQPDIEYGQFKYSMKTFLYSKTVAHKWLLPSCTVYKLIYLLTYFLIKQENEERRMREVKIVTLEYCQSSWWWMDERAGLHHDTESWQSLTAVLDATCHTARLMTVLAGDTAVD